MCRCRKSVKISGGTFEGVAAGRGAVSAAYSGETSNLVDVEVWQVATVGECAMGGVSDAWADNLSKATLETTCRKYSTSRAVPIIFSAGIDEKSWRHTLDVCLDLYIYDTNRNLVRTIRDYGCSRESLFHAMPGYKPVFEYTALWNQRDNAGNPVPPGEYTAIARFYLLYCPVLKVNFEIR